VIRSRGACRLPRKWRCSPVDGVFEMPAVYWTKEGLSVCVGCRLVHGPNWGTLASDVQVEVRGQSDE